MKVIDDVLKNKILEDLVAAEPEKQSAPEITEAKVETVIPLLKEIEKNNGYNGIAEKVDLTASQIALIHKKMKEKIDSLTEPKEV